MRLQPALQEGYPRLAMVRPSSSEGVLAHPLFRVGVFTVIYMALAIAFVIARGNTEFLFYVGVMFVLIGMIASIHRSLSLSTGLLWALSIWGALHLAGGLVTIPDHWPADGEFRVLYSWWILSKAPTAGDPGGLLKYDQVIHFYGFGVATWLCWQILCGTLGRDARDSKGVARLRPTPGLMFLVASAGMGLGALNEVIEFIATRITVTNVGGYVNTGWDLIYNALGASVAAAILYKMGNASGEGSAASDSDSLRI